MSVTEIVASIIGTIVFIVVAALLSLLTGVLLALIYYGFKFTAELLSLPLPL